MFSAAFCQYAIKMMMMMMMMTTTMMKMTEFRVETHIGKACVSWPYSRKLFETS